MVARGCELCLEGAKLVLFVTGVCRIRCGYCPLSETRWQKDVVYANERPITKDEELIEEAALIDALGTGITGGDPLLRLERTLHYASLLKDTFTDHHIHLYTASSPDEEKLQKMEGRIDELRFHLTDFTDISPVEKALKFAFDVGVEIPMFPSRVGETRSLIQNLKKAGIDFINLNELEYADRNVTYLQRLGYSFDSDSCRVLGSEEAARQLEDDIVHYCSSSAKDSIQLRNRLIRRANHVKKPYEDVEDTLLVRGVIVCTTPEDAHTLSGLLKARVDIPDSFVEVVETCVFTHWALAEEAATWAEVQVMKARVGIEKRYPTFDQPLIEYIPIY